tara:strand:+ start:59 stop:364 length:306 start_codon:yes stop_codon:yes gene_type:complete
MTIAVDSISCHKTKIVSSIIIFLKTAAILVLISFIHWVIVTIYNIWCHDSSYWGIINNIFKVGSPICITLNKLQLALSENYIAFIISLGIGFGAFIKNISS